MHKKYIYIFLYGFFTLSFAQYINSEINLTQYPQGYLIESLSGIGLGNNVVSETSIISNANPASMVDYNGFNLGFSYQFESIIDPYAESTIHNEKKRWNDYLPHSLGIVYQINNSRIGIGLNQNFNMHRTLGPIELERNTGMEVDTIKVTDYEKVSIVRGSFLFSHSLLNLFSKEGCLTLGIKMDYFGLNSHFGIIGTEEKYKMNSYGFTMGVRYDNNIDSDLDYGIAFKYEKGSKLKKEIKDPTEIISITPENDTLYIRTYTIGIVPDKTELGAEFAFNRFSVIINSSYIIWQNYKDYKYEYKFDNQFDFSGSAIYKFTNILRASLGFYKKHYAYSKNEIYDDSKLKESISSLYFTTGFNIEFNRIEIDFALADSHFFSDEYTKQTIFKMGINYKLF